MHESERHRVILAAVQSRPVMTVADLCEVTGSSEATIRRDIAALDEPPLRLLLGAGAVEMAEKASEARAAETRQWADVSRSADFPAEVMS